MSYKERNPNGNAGRIPNVMAESAISEQLRALAAEDRRHLLRYLLESGGNAASTTELVEHVADVTDTSVEQVQVRMRHDHLPSLLAAGLVDTDPETETVSYAGGELVTELLETTTEHGPPSSIP